MRKLPLLLATAAVLGGLSAISVTSAQATPCVAGSVGSYAALGATGCSIGPVTFSNITVTSTTSGSGTVTLSDFTPVTFNVGSVTEYGLDLSYSSSTGATPKSAADINWIYNVSANLLSDVYASLSGTTTGTGSDTLSETLSNGTTLALTVPGAMGPVSFTPVDNLHVVKDQNDLSNSATDCGGTCAETSSMTNAFSVTPGHQPPPPPVPEPASLVLLGSALAGMGWLGRRRRQG